MTAESDIQQKLRLLQEQYTAAMPGKLSDLSAQWQCLVENRDDEEQFEFVIRQFHTIAGSGTSFGFPEVTQVARDAEKMLKADQKAGKGLTNNTLTDIPLCLEKLKSSASLGPSFSVTAEVPSSKLPKPDTPRDPHLIFLINGAQQSDKEIPQQLAYYSYIVVELGSPKDIDHALKQQLPGAIIFNLNQLDDEYSRIIHRLKFVDGYEEVPIAVISSKNDTMQRLQAVRAGANAFLCKPFDYPALVDTLDNLTASKDPQPFRILIMDDVPSSAEFYSIALQGAGMQTQVVNEPLTIMQHIQEFRPELILMDIYMPHCKGTELAVVIRQDESYVGTPIVFLSSETDADAQQLAMSYGGDDFLTKPIKSEHLVSAITTRAQRYRKLRSFMVNDSLTGLYNHTSTKEMLSRELSRAVRKDSPISFCMIDIDNFKLVNDNYGHPTGDRVIKILARLLKQRLRGTDIIGRYGGEEFAVIMPETDAATALEVINQIRDSFESVHLAHGDERVKLSFSAGIADFPRQSNAIMLNDAADKAMYQAKSDGRNRVVLANPPVSTE